MNTRILRQAWRGLLARPLLCDSLPHEAGWRRAGERACACARVEAVRQGSCGCLRGHVPENYAFVPESETVVTATERRDFDFGVLVDCEGPERVGSAADAVTSAAKTACIDHHVPNGGFGEIRVVDTQASATAVVLYEMLTANDVELDSVIATQLLAALIADTGGFRFGNTNARSFEVAAELTKLGAEPSTIYQAIFDSKPIRSGKLLGRALNSMKTDESGRVIWAEITQTDLAELGATDADTDSIVNHIGAIKGPRVAILFRETKPGVIRTSLRSRGGYDVDRVARVFDGGGHKAAVGLHGESAACRGREDGHR